ncbi:serine phosphatase RsbU (regulator of sigma subunit) [Allocatelliglobosispora scoriae]|uniref:Serine phosphatase RsbU (Regulator of sigma subunit) n=1 Tax=Allocatelliglobosispora scoriae TaxID=643052 RepID=A0A841BJX4_9ACTN|nr:PP2C family protein-serine/threonine phosphatase [Allocatelliglobosispora scoriae]MBB5867638.1 serine phosphatase RsbU (regulator of sigma subunit) [Allocatelliglobosispora scoriae]
MSRTDEPILTGIRDAAADASPSTAIEAVTRHLCGVFGASGISFLTADLGGKALVRIVATPSGEVEEATVLPFDGGPRERALRTQKVLVGDGPAGWTVFAPVVERGDVIGLLEIELPAEPTPETVTDIGTAAEAMAFVVIANRRHTDIFEAGQRTTPVTLSAEIQRRLLPAAFTCEADTFALSAWLEPSASIAGDSFDYSLIGDVLHFSVTDAMGHGVESALTATLCVGSLRNTRRRRRSLIDQAHEANDTVAERASPTGSYVTALLGRLNLRTGACALLNAGHVRPLLVRDGESREIALPLNFPLGMFVEAEFEAGSIALEPGDRLVLLTDGMRDRDAAALDIPAHLRKLADRHPREAVRAIADAVLDLAGPTLADDAALLILDWRGPI